MIGNCRYFLSLILIIVSIVRKAHGQFDPFPEIPSHLPSPPKADAGAPAARQNADGGAANIGGFFGGSPPLPPPQNNPFVGPGGPVGPGPGPPPPELVPFGLKNVILIMVPQFKTTFKRLPKWLTSSFKISMPISGKEFYINYLFELIVIIDSNYLSSPNLVFFDQLHIPPEFMQPPFLPPPGGPLPPPGPGIPPAVAPGGVPPAGPATNPQTASAGWYPYYTSAMNPYYSEEDGDPYDSDNYENGGGDYYSSSDDERKRRRRRRHALLKRSLPFNQTIHSTERAALLPKIGSILESAGLGGKACLLRTICEVHEAPLTHYGLLGELLTKFFRYPFF